MTFIKGRNSFLVFIALCNWNHQAWVKSLLGDIVWDQTHTSDRHKQRLIDWGYKKGLFNTKDLSKGIWLTDKGRDYVSSHATDEDYENGMKMYVSCMKISEAETRDEKSIT